MSWSLAPDATIRLPSARPRCVSADVSKRVSPSPFSPAPNTRPPLASQPAAIFAFPSSPSRLGADGVAPEAASAAGPDQTPVPSPKAVAASLIDLEALAGGETIRVSRLRSPKLSVFSLGLAPTHTAPPSLSVSPRPAYQQAPAGNHTT